MVVIIFIPKRAADNTVMYLINDEIHDLVGFPARNAATPRLHRSLSSL
jgi:hypothetical protein